MTAIGSEYQIHSNALPPALLTLDGAAELALPAPDAVESLWMLYRSAWHGTSAVDLDSLFTRAKALLTRYRVPELAALVDCLNRDLTPYSLDRL
jgi:hypothetical protein